MDFTTFITTYGPATVAIFGTVAAAAWAVFKLVAPLTKSTADDEFIAEHGETVEDVLDKVDGK